MNLPGPPDPEIAGMTLAHHLTRFLAQPGRADDFELRELDGLHAVVAIRAQRDDGKVDWYSTVHDATYYDIWPTRVFFGREVEQEWVPATFGDVEYPLIAGSPIPSGAVPGTAPIQFALHHAYPYPDGHAGHLVCCSASLDYYVSDHSPSEAQRWRQGVHTISALLTRIHTVLQAPTYKGPSGVVDS